MTRVRYRLGPFEVELVCEGRTFRGFGSIRCAGRDLRDGRVLAGPSVESSEGHVFGEWSVSRVRTKASRLHVDLVGRGRRSVTGPDRNCYGDPNVTPLSDAVREVDGSLGIDLHADEWLGLPRLRIRTRFSSRSCRIDWIVERYTWELNGSSRGCTYFAQRWGTEHGGWEHPLDRAEHFSTRDAMQINGQLHDLGSVQPRGGGGPAMDFIYSRQGALCLFREDLTHVRGMVEKRRGESVLNVVDQCWANRSSRQVTPWLSVVVYRGRLTYEQAHDLWTRFYDAYSEPLAVRTGIGRPTPLPAVFCETWNMGSGHFFEHQKKFLAAIAASGAKRVLLHTLPHPHENHNCCANHTLDILGSEGGLDALRDYTESAHALGLEVFGWVGGSLNRKSPLFQEHPDWAVRNARGEPFGGGYHVLTAMDFGNPGFRKYYVSRLRSWHEEGGLDGLWLDSLLNLHFYGINARRPASCGGPGPHVDGLLACLRQLSRCGLQIVTEGISPIGTSAGSIGFSEIKEAALSGNLLFPHLNCGEHALYRTNLWARGSQQVAGRTLTRDRYFRALAHAAPIALYYDTSDYPNALSAHRALPLTPPVSIPRYRQMNDLYMNVLPHLQVRQLLPGDQGVVWHPREAQPGDLSAQSLVLDPAECPGTRILFAFRNGEVRLPGKGWAGLKVQDLELGWTRTLTGPGFRFRKHGVYRMDAPSASTAGESRGVHPGGDMTGR